VSASLKKSRSWFPSAKFAISAMRAAREKGRMIPSAESFERRGAVWIEFWRGLQNRIIELPDRRESLPKRPEDVTESRESSEYSICAAIQANAWKFAKPNMTLKVGSH
jgi:hypothetical protein